MSGFLPSPTFAAPVRPIPLGSSGQVLTMVAGLPTFANASGGSGAVLGTFLAVALSSGANNNLNPAPVGPPVWPAGYGRLDLSAAAAANVTGLVAGADGQMILVRNSGAHNVTLNTANAGSAAANRFLFVADLILPPGATALAVYYAASTGINSGAGGWVLR